MAEEAVAEKSGFDAAYNDNVVVQEAGDEVVTEDVRSPEPEEGESAEESAETKADESADEGGETAESEAVLSDREQLTAKFASERQLDPNDKRDKAVLKQLVDKELHIRKLESEARERRDSQEDDGNDGLTEFERELLKTASKKPGEEEADTAKAEDDETGDAPLIDPSKWKKPRDVVEAQLKAWEAATKKGDYEAVIEYENAAFNARLAARENELKEMFRGILREELGDVLPAVNETAARSRRDAAIDFATEQLSKMDGYGDVRDLWKADGEPLKVNGKELPNTPLNRILSENPALLNIRIDHEDPNTAERLTMIQVLRTVHKLNKRAQGSPKKAQQLMDAGAEAERRKTQEQKRQGLNKGSGAPEGTGKPGSYVDSIKDMYRGRTKISEMKPTFET